MGARALRPSCPLLPSTAPTPGALPLLLLSCRRLLRNKFPPNPGLLPLDAYRASTGRPPALAARRASEVLLLALGLEVGSARLLLLAIIENGRRHLV